MKNLESLLLETIKTPIRLVQIVTFSAIHSDKCQIIPDTISTAIFLVSKLINLSARRQFERTEKKKVARSSKFAYKFYHFCLQIPLVKNWCSMWLMVIASIMPWDLVICDYDVYIWEGRRSSWGRLQNEKSKDRWQICAVAVTRNVQE